MSLIYPHEGGGSISPHLVFNPQFGIGSRCVKLDPQQEQKVRLSQFFPNQCQQRNSTRLGSTKRIYTRSVKERGSVCDKLRS